MKDLLCLKSRKFSKMFACKCFGNWETGKHEFVQIRNKLNVTLYEIWGFMNSNF